MRKSAGVQIAQVAIGEAIRKRLPVGIGGGDRDAGGIARDTRD